MKNGDYREQGSMLEPSIKQPGCMYYSGQNTYEIGNSSTGHMCVLEFDGSSRGVPRYGGAGGILLNESSEIVYELRVGLGEVSNNAAEYLALIYGMRTALHLGMYRLQARGNSSLIVCQVGGDMAVGPELSVYHRDVMMLSRLFEVFKICELTRAENGRADKAAEEGLEYPVTAGVMARCISDFANVTGAEDCGWREGWLCGGSKGENGRIEVDADGSSVVEIAANG